MLHDIQCNFVITERIRTQAFFAVAGNLGALKRYLFAKLYSLLVAPTQIIIVMYMPPSTATTSWTLKCTDLPQFDALEAEADLFRTDDKLHLRNLCNNSARCAGLTVVYTTPGHRKIVYDYSRQRVTGETIALLFHLADAVGLAERREAMRTGQRINLTEDRPVLHHVLRMPADFHFVRHDPMAGKEGGAQATDGATTLRNVHEVRERVRDFAERVRSGAYKSVKHKHFRNTIVIGTGGFKIGPQFVADALQADPAAMHGSAGRRLLFLSNMDPVDFSTVAGDLDPAETLVVVVSKTFTAPETILNARTAKTWLVQNMAVGGITENEIVGKHMIGITSNPTLCQKFGIRRENIYMLWDWVNPRFSVCSAAGLLPLSIHFSSEVLSEVLNGAHDMDKHFFHAPLGDNIPVIMGLLGVWNSTFLGYHCRAVLPYSHAMRSFPNFVQHVDMESNGKRVALDGSSLLHRSAEITLGEPGTNVQNVLMQLMHQGRPFPADFIGFMEAQQHIHLENEALSNHDELMSNFFAQPDALAYGKTLVDLIQEGIPEPLREHMVFNGNRPSSSILMTRLDAFAVGQLIAMYEHRTAVQGFIWGINSWDQFGVELGKVLATHIRSQLSASRKTGASVQGFNSSTSSLLEHFLAHGKHPEPTSTEETL